MKPRLQLALLLAALAGLLTAAAADPGDGLPRATLHAREFDGQTYWLYLPRGFEPGGRVLVVVHGSGRWAEEHARAWVAMAERQQVAVVAPLFDLTSFPDYQRLNFGGPRADLKLHAVLEEVERLTGADVSQFYLFGFSGGGQFAHRYALAHPQRLRRLAVAAPGWWCLPDPDLDYPYGLRRTPQVPPDVDFRLDDLLALPLAVVVGARDTERDSSLRQDGLINRLQGRTRVERARRWYEWMQRLAEQRKISPRLELHVIPGVGHNGTHPDLIKRAAAFLFPAGEN